MFKIGDKVVCVSPDLKETLALDNIYTVEAVSASLYGEVVDYYFIRVKDEDKSYEMEYNPNRFKLYKEELYKFQTGDLVEFGGLSGVVLENDRKCPYPVNVTFGNLCDPQAFTSTGKFITQHPKPLLNLVKRAPKKIMIEICEDKAKLLGLI